MMTKKVSQVQMLFPKGLYPIHSRYIQLFSKMLSKQDICVSESDIQILSIALGSTSQHLFKTVTSKTSVRDKLESLLTNGLKLKVEVKKRLATYQTELSKESNQAVVNLVISQYQSKLDEIETRKQQAIFEQQKKLLEERKTKAEALQKQLRAEKEVYSASRVSFEDFEIFDIQKNSRVDILLTQLRKKSITPDDMTWLNERGFSNQLVERQYHIQLAHQHFQNWKQKNQLWELVNASASYRKARELKKIKKTLDEVYPFKEAKKDKKLKSALLTTYGGVCRDLHEYDRGIDLGHEAHKVTLLSFRPCTLLGAIYLSTGEFTLGHEWYDKAKERGFSQAAYDNDIKSVYFRASEEVKNRLKQNLIATGHNYKWL
ncbi:hypothetical protein HWQ46_13385 [Shewanella sp. D64]|uniref:hypothetical protein n=1 Tax=unclassified Shewanella TaxID=196818 RepID=UPI0022BA40E7|nr:MULTISPECIES: hypothetical protein [unclassified Shewanella]MEC4726543.1 hypothetical protein [Shewanella sp. D64]MEC4737416.1 hypothetical protein [Shewanella sp. E94]WBJ97235.1 hypothetical protein HWQ47_09110 [Shewanella sp. MTB7]